MKKIFIAFILVGLLFISGCSKKQIEKMSVDEKIDYKIKSMTLEEKIAQMTIVYYNSPTFDDNLKKSLEKNQPGGFILQGINITTYSDTLDYVKKIQETAKIPMFISIDQEGGLVQRLYNLKDVKPTYIPAMYEVGETKDEALVYNIGEVMAKELRTVGINLVYAPVIDVFTNKENTVIGNRAFGNDTQTVIDMAIPLAKGLSDNEVIPVYKHFPGHGDTFLDTHFDLPIVKKTLDELKDLELLPFKAAIESNASVIMVGHIAYPNITGDDTPATLSKKMVTDVLRKDLGFDGVVITDALNMGALTENYTDEEIYEMAINAGVDILLMPNGSEKTIKIIKKSIENGKITEKRINQSLKRILKLKYKYLMNSNFLGEEYLNKKEHQDILDKVK